MTKLETKAVEKATAEKAEKKARIEQIKASLEKIAKLEKISPQLNDIVEKTISIETAEPLQKIYASIDAINRKNKEYTKFQMLCIILQCYNKIKEYKEYSQKQFILNCDDIFKMSQMQNDLFFSGYCNGVTTHAMSEREENTKEYKNIFQCKFTLKYCYGTKAEILENKGVQIIAPTKEEQQEQQELKQEEIALAESLLLGAGLSTNLLVKK